MSNRHPVSPTRAMAFAAVISLALSISACGENGDPEPTDPLVVLSGESGRTPVSIGGVRFSVEVPVELGDAEDQSREGECGYAEESFGTLPTGSDDHDPKLFFASTARPCPGQQAVNGRFPSWAHVRDLPDEAAKLDLSGPIGSAYSFTVAYTQCTNECYGRTYDVVFVTLDDGTTFWMQSSDLDGSVTRDVLGSFRRA